MARNTPNAGSVTQSSTGAGGVTADSVSVEVERDTSGTISLTVREAGGWSVDRASARVLREESGDIGKIVEFHQAPGGGQGSGTGPGLYVRAGAEYRDSDYLAGGIWVRVPADAASVADYEFGVFVDGNDPFRQANLAGLTGTARYSRVEGATATYSDREAGRNYFVHADVTLTADFGDAGGLGSIGGTLSNFIGEDLDLSAYAGAVITLGTASIGSADSGFFTGDTSSRGTDGAFTGKWGGRFYGNGAAGARPGHVGGTFGGATADGSEAFVGGFLTDLQ